MAFLTIFTAPKPFTNPHINLIQRNAIQSWRALGADVQVVLIGREAGMAELAQELNLPHLTQCASNEKGTPLINSIFSLAREASQSPVLAYVNADVMLLPDFLEAAHQSMAQARQFLVVGQRWDLAVQEPLAFGPEWDKVLEQRVAQNGRLHQPAGSDYFLFPRSCFTELPPFAVGRAGWDNWMIYYARRQGWWVIDATQSIIAIHQDHDYSHLPGGKPHYHLPESNQNTALAGGRRAIFSLLDANRQLKKSHVVSPTLTLKKVLREVEIFPLISLKSLALGQVSFTIFHPKQAFQEYRGWLAWKLSRKSRPS
ncbi:MAG TPA: hypothetical protein VF326_03745 [Anaerolineaceae bacterium]|jgi:hypothetical protein